MNIAALKEIETIENRLILELSNNDDTQESQATTTGTTSATALSSTSNNNDQYYEENKAIFKKKILDAQHGPTRKLYSRDRINEIINIIKENKDLKNVKKDSAVYYLLDNFKIYKIGQQEHLIAANEEIKHIAANEDLYDIILEAHKIVGHGGIKKMAKQLKQKYHNITEKSLKIFKGL